MVVLDDELACCRGATHAVGSKAIGVTADGTMFLQVLIRNWGRVLCAKESQRISFSRLQL